MTQYIDFVFNTPPGPESDFIECENDLGQSINAGEWFQRADGYWVLRVYKEIFNG